MRGETRSRARISAIKPISIHSPHARGDVAAVVLAPLAQLISIHSPHARGDAISSTRLHRRAYFNPLPSCEGRRGGRGRMWMDKTFQSTPLMRGETVVCNALRNYLDISIHSPHTRGDEKRAWRTRTPTHFNPLPSCEGRHIRYHDTRSKQPISIHSPHARGDSGAMKFCPTFCSFQSTPLMRGETHLYHFLLSLNLFQSTPLMRGETADAAATGKRLAISIHSPHARGDRRCIRPHTGLPTISIHSPHARGDL